MRLQLLHLYSDWFKTLASVYQPMRRKTKEPITTCMRDFSRSLSKLHGIATNSDWFIALFAPAVIGRSNYFGILFYDIQLKTAQITNDIIV